MSKVTKVVPPRLHVLLRKKTAVVILRGRGKSAATFGWNLKDDSFALGQWFRGRIYALRCDLSPDGKHLIYFAAKYWRNDAVFQRKQGHLFCENLLVSISVASKERDRDKIRTLSLERTVFKGHPSKLF